MDGHNIPGKGGTYCNCIRYLRRTRNLSNRETLSGASPAYPCLPTQLFFIISYRPAQNDRRRPQRPYRFDTKPFRCKSIASPSPSSLFTPPLLARLVLALLSLCGEPYVRTYMHASGKIFYGASAASRHVFFVGFCFADLLFLNFRYLIVCFFCCVFLQIYAFASRLDSEEIPL